MSLAKRRKGEKTKARLQFAGIALGTTAIMFAIGYFFAVRFLFPPLPTPKNGIVVPSVAGLTVPNAEAKLRQLGLRVVEIVEITHPSQPPGIVVAQSPLPGQQLRELGEVRLGVSIKAGE